MAEQLRLGGAEDRRVALAQYDTPPELATRQVAMIDEGRRLWWEGSSLPRTARVLEPSGGCGALIRALLARYPHVRVEAAELDPARATLLRELGRAVAVHEGDYLERPAPARRYDLCISNPPFSAGVEREHLRKMLDESERAIVQLPIRALHGQARTRDVWSRIGRDFWIHAEVRVAERVYPNASDDIVLLDLRRQPGLCRLAWWTR